MARHSPSRENGSALALSKEWLGTRPLERMARHSPSRENGSALALSREWLGTRVQALLPNATTYALIKFAACRPTARALVARCAATCASTTRSDTRLFFSPYYVFIGWNQYSTDIWSGGRTRSGCLADFVDVLPRLGEAAPTGAGAARR
jgi:hypothetical protein